MRIHRYEPLIWIAAVFLAACSLGQNEEQADIIESDSSVQVTDTHVATQETPQQVTDIPSVTPTQGGFQPDATSEEDPEEATQQVRDRIPPEGRWQMTYYDGEIICDSVTDEIPTNSEPGHPGLDRAERDVLCDIGWDRGCPVYPLWLRRLHPFRFFRCD